MTRPVQPSELVLASSSPRRRELLRERGYMFDVVVPPFEEPDERPHVAAHAHASSLAYFKASSVARDRADKTILAADTIAWIDGHIIGKPRDRDDARRILKTLSGTTHEVITGVALVRADHGKRLIEHDATLIRVRHLSDQMIDDYLDTGLWEGKAGAYGIQDGDDPFVETLQGSFSNVVGLPIELIERMFATWCGEAHEPS